MTKKQTFITILLIIIVGITFFFYKQKDRSENQNPTLSASFGCDDNSHFIAEFKEINKVNIIADGVTTKNLPRTDGDGQRFEDASSIYVFAGEEVSVTNKATNKMTICHQPLDPNNAPINFGDAAEGAGAKQNLAMIVGENILGKWQSLDDVKFAREFKPGNIVDKIYDGKLISIDSWKIFTKATTPTNEFPLENNTPYLQIKLTDKEPQAVYFKISKLTPEELELIYLDRGGILNFKAIGK